jgi:hypothetical protein
VQHEKKALPPPRQPVLIDFTLDEECPTLLPVDQGSVASGLQGRNAINGIHGESSKML